MNGMYRREFEEILSICERYGYGNVMEMASAIWRNKMKENGLPPAHAAIPVIPALCNQNDDGIAIGKQTRALYDNIVHDFMGEK